MNKIATVPNFMRNSCTTLLLLTLPILSFATSSNFVKKLVEQMEARITTAFTTLDIPVSKQAAPALHPLPINVMPPCPGGSGVVGGTVFQDFNLNGVNDQVGVISGIQVDIFRCDADGNSELVGTTTSEEDGSYSFDGLTDGDNYRLEFRIPDALGFLSAGGAGGGGTNVQFHTSPTCDADVGFLNTDDYCDPDPLIAVACYVNGDPLAAGSGSADEEAIVAFRYTASGNDEKIKLATAEEVGAVYGMAYQKTAKRIFAASFVKRHVGLGPLGLGGIYQIDYAGDTPVVSPFVDVSSLGIDIGNMLTNAERGLSADPNFPNNDAQAYDAVGKWGLGGLDLSADESTLWFMNLAQQTLHSLAIDSDGNPATAPTAGDLNSFPLPTAGCVGGTFRPFAVRSHQGEVYVGGVCDAAMSDNSADLEAVIYRLDGNNFVEVTRISLDYDKGYTTFANRCEDFPGWYPWRADLPPACSDNEIFRVYPTPILTDMVFDVDNSLILGFTDRMGHQIGFKNYPLEGTSPLLQTISGGDILRLYNDNGTYVLENNGTAGSNTTAGAGNNEGPGGGEFYYRDVFEGPIDNLVDPQPHTETAQGGLAFVPGSGEVVTTALDPYSTQFNSGGVNWLNNTTGENRNPGFLLYRSSNSSISTFSKANGLGDIVAMCNLAPIEIGAYVWKDENNNGVQDPCEPPIVGVNVSIFDADGNWLATTETDETGQFFFNNTIDGLEEGLQPNTQYFVAVGTNGDFNVASGMLMDAGFITEVNQGVGPEPEVNDSDGVAAPAGVADGAFTGLPYIDITTGGPGFVEHDMDFGFGTIAPEPILITGTVWEDVDKDGIRDENEPPIAGITITLYDSDGNVVATTTSDENGNYIFSVTAGGEYYIIFDPMPTVNEVDYVLTQDNVGDETIDSDADPTTGQTVIFIVDIDAGIQITHVDAGYIPDVEANASIGDLVFLDCNNNGIQDEGEVGVEGVAVTLINVEDNSELTTTTDANGIYTFSNLLPNNYRVQFTLSVSDLVFSPINQGADDIDSDVDASGLSDLIDLAESEQNTSVDAGIVDQVAPVFNENLPEENLSFECSDGTFPDPPVLTASDNFTTNIEVIFTAEATGGQTSGCANGGITYTWTATDDCGNTISHQQVINFNDDENPSFNETLPQDLTITDCSAGGVPTAAVLTASDNCDDDVEVTFTEETDSSGSACVGLIIIRTWTATDDCGNTISHEQNITFNDINDPTFDGTLPQDRTITDCSAGGVPPAAVLTASDDCDDEVEITFEETTGGGNDCAGATLIRTWTATDECGNSVSHQQTITFNDTAAPTFDGTLPQDLTITDCSAGGVPTAAVLTASDDCDDNVEVVFEETTGGGNDCAGAMLIRTWTATDDCGNSVSHQQTITFNDTAAPTFDGTLPQDLTVTDCSAGGVPSAAVLTASDDCDDNVDVAFEETTGSGNDCAGATLIRTWTATDDCGNSVSHQQTITFNDTAAPIFTSTLPQDLTITDCNASGIPSAATLTASDNCDMEVEVVFAETTDNENNCAGATLIRTWTATDDCGNSISHQQTITFNDTAAPTFNESLPQDQTITDCNDSGNIATPAVLTASDNCDDNVEVAFAETTTNIDNCAGATLIRTWTATDDCGNTISHQQTISFNDTQAPTFTSTLPQDRTSENCSGNVGQAPVLTASDNCDDNVEVTLEERPIFGECAGNGIMRIWTATDDCGNTITHEQNITFIDNTAPIFTGPLPQDIDAGQACGVADISNPPTLTASDNCDNDVSVLFEQNFVDGNNDGCAGGTLIRTWTATDDCGNTVTHQQSIVFGDNQPPAFIGVLPPNMSGVACIDFDMDNPPRLAATDACDQNVEITLVQEIQDGDITSCAGGTLVRTWTATDDCGNAVTHIQVITFTDTAPPTITGVPDDVTVECDDIPGVPIVKAVDDCGGEVRLDFQETQTTGCPYTITRSWKATDSCGNMASDSQVITVIDTIPPIIFYSNPHLIGLQNNDTLFVSCDNVPVLGDRDVRVVDNCDADPDIDFVDFIVNTADCQEDGYLAYMFCGWVATDECGNVSQLNIHIVVEDNDPPVLVGVPADVTITSAGTLPDIPDVTATDNCDNNVQVRFDQEIINNDCGHIVKRTWTATDDCGNIAIGVQIITIDNNCDCPDPMVSDVQTTNAACGAANGTASFTLGGNASDYIITWTPNVGTPNGGNTMRSDLPAGTYIVNVTYPLADDCSFEKIFQINGDQPNNPSVKVTNITCPGGQNGGIRSQDNRSYTIQQNGTTIGNTPQNNLTAGTYQVSYSNADGCRSSIDVIITEPAPITVSVEQQNVSCAGNDGAISLTVNGGNGGFIFNWDPLITTNSFATGLSAGTYRIMIADSEGCSQMVTIDIEEDCQTTCDLSLTAQKMDAGCDGNTGSITVTASGTSNSGNITYTWSPNVSATNTATNLMSGTYTITAFDNQSQCEATTTVNIGQSTAPPTPQVSTSNALCAGDCNGSITSNDGRVYIISQGDTQIGIAPITNLCAGTYTVTYTDDNNCSSSTDVTITAPSEFMATVTTQADSCSLGIGSITVAASGGTPPYNFMINGEVIAGNQITGLSAGDYAVWLMDANGCGTEPGNFVIPNIECEQTCDLSIGITSSDARCGEDNGAVNVFVEGALGNIRYEWNPDVSDTNIATNLSVGTYMVRAIDDMTGCVTEAMAIIQQTGTSATPQVDVQNADCAGTCTGSITATDNRTYDIMSNGNVIGTTPMTNLCAGTYGVRFTDETGCTNGMEVRITAPPALVANVLTTADSCSTSNGTITISAMGGTPPYNYLVNGAVAASNSITNLAAGTYTIEVIDNNGCSTESGLIATVGTKECELTCDLMATATAMPATCGDSNGRVDVQVTGAIGNIVYEWNPDITDAATATNVAAGVYQITVRDEMTGCVGNTMVTVEAIEEEVAVPAIFVNNTSCAESNDGRITATDGRTYEVFLGGNLIGQTPQTTLSAGTYMVRATSSGTCTSEVSVTIEAAAPIFAVANTSPDDCDGGAGNITLNVGGGTENYTYMWTDNVSTSNTATGLDSGNYGVTITDANGCTASIDNIVVGKDCTPIACRLEGTATITPAVCGQMNGRVDLSVTGAVGNLLYTWSPNVATTSSATNLAPGDYTVMVTDDAATCELEFEINLPEAPLPNGPNVRITFPLCVDEDNNTATIMSNDERTFQVFQHGSLLGSTPLEGVAEGMYNIVYEDENGCTSDLDIEVALSDPITVTPTVTPARCGADDGAITLAVTGGNSDTYTYLWQPAVSTSSSASNLAAGDYTIFVRDAEGCVERIEVTVTETGGAASPQVNTTNVGCAGGNDGRIMSADGRTYQIFDVVTNERMTSGEALTAGTYRIEYTSVSGCTSSIEVTLTQPDDLSISATNLSPESCTGNDGSINLNVTGGNPDYTYEWSDPSIIGNNATGLSAGTYDLTVTDQNGCQIFESYTITLDCQCDLTINLLSAKDATCGEANGSISVNVTGNIVGDLVYAWTPNISTTDLATDLAAGRYELTVSDAISGCSTTMDFLITAVGAPPAPAIEVTGITCGGDSDGAITATEGRVYQVFRGENFLGDTPVNGLAPAAYTITATNDSGCSISTTATIAPLTAIETAVASFPAGCEGNSGVVSIDVQGGVAPYTFQWTDNVSNFNVAAGLAPGRYDATITDAQGCVVQISTMVGRVCNVPTDLVTVTIPHGETTNYCLPETVLQPTGVLTSGFILDEGNENTVLGTDFNGQCINLTPSLVFSGESLDTIRVISCFDMGMEVCDVTFIVVTVECPPSLLGGSELSVSGLTGVQCLNVEAAELAGLHLMLDGEEVTQPYNSCNFNPLAVFDYQDYELDGSLYQVQFNVNGQPYTGAITSMFELADLLNQWDVVSNWINDPVEKILIGGAAPFNYGTLLLTHASGAPIQLDAEEVSQESGIQVDLGEGVNTVLLMSDNGCEEIINLTTEPVEGSFRFVDFGAAANLEQTEVQLQWQTLAEDEVARFFVEHSTDSIKFRTMEHMIEANGPSDDINSYDLMDDAPRLGYNYYRIRYVNNRGEVIRTLTIRVFIQPADTADVVVYPNPVYRDFTVDFLEPLAAEATIQIVNGYGQILQEITIDAGEIRKELSLKGYPNAMYYVKINYNVHRQEIYRVAKHH